MTREPSPPEQVTTTGAGDPCGQALLYRACREAGLTRRQQDVTLAYYHGQTQAAIAAELGISFSGAGEVLAAAERKLRRYYVDVQEEAEAEARTHREMLRLLRNTDIEDWEVELAAPPARNGRGAPGPDRLRARVMTAEDLVPALTGLRGFLRAYLAYYTG